MQHPHDRLRFMVDPGGGPGDEVLYEQESVGGPQERVGWFRFHFDDERWEWSPEVELMHGYPPGTVTPTTELVLSHKHPRDQRHVAEAIEKARSTRQPFSSRHRICDTEGHVHHVLVVGDLLRGKHGDVIGTHGFYVDLTPVLREVRQDRLTATVAEITESRAVIEQVKGMLMAIYDIDADAAFNLLKWRSQETNVKLRQLAEQIAVDFSKQGHDGKLPLRSAYDHVLMTAHLRVAK